MPDGPVRFRYELVGSGWALVELTIGEQHATARVTYLADADPVPRLVRELARLLAADAPPRDEVVCRFADEPGEWTLDLRRAGARLHVLVHWRRDRDDDTETLLDAVCSLHGFATAVADELARLLRALGPAEYAARWWGDAFPVDELAALQRSLSREPPA